MHINIGGDVHWEWPDQRAAWNLEFLREDVRELCLETTTTTACALGVKHPLFKKTGRTAMANCMHDKKTIGRQHHETRNNYHTLGIPQTPARRVCRALMETTSGEEVFALIAAAADTGVNDSRCTRNRNSHKETEKPT